MSEHFIKVCIFLVVLLLIDGQESNAENRFQSFETVSNSISDGWSSMTEMDRTRFENLGGGMESKFDRRFVLVPGSVRNGNKRVNQHQIRSNQIGASSDEGETQSRYFGPFSFLFRKRGFWSEARSAELPPLSLETSSRNTNRLSSELAKIMNVKNGHYTDIYNELGNNKNNLVVE